MNQRRSLETYYNNLARAYDHVTRASGWIPPAVASSLIAPHVREGTRVLDIGIGTGQAIAGLLDRGARVCGIDVSHNMLRRASDKYPELELHRMDIDEGPGVLGGRRFDVVTAIGVLDLVRDLRQVLGSIKDLTAENGHLCFTFEELIEGHEIQGARQAPASLSGPRSLLRHGKGNVEVFETRRYEFGEVDAAIAEAGFGELEARRFVAYERTERRLPVHYGIVLCRNLSESGVGAMDPGHESAK